MEAAKIKINSFIEDYEKMASLVQRVSTSISSGQLAKWTSELTTLSTVTPSTSSQVVASFLRSAGQTQLLDQLESVETGFRINLDKMRASLNLGLQLFGHCTTMVRRYTYTVFFSSVFSLLPNTFRHLCIQKVTRRNTESNFI